MPKPLLAPPAASPLFRLDRNGWLTPAEGIRHAPSPNFDARTPETSVTLLVLHNISLPPGQFGGSDVVAFFQNHLDFDKHPWYSNIRKLRVSAHFFVRRSGEVVQFVSTWARAWHAGVSQFEGRSACNDFSIGVELEGTDHVAYEDAQYTTLAKLSSVLRARHPIRAVRGHEHIAPGRKTDPGVAFDWERFSREAQWPSRLLPRRSHR